MPAGRPKKLKSPEELWQLFESYVKWAKKNPIPKMVFVGRDGRKDYELIERPLSRYGFETFCFNNQITVEPYLDNDYGNYENFRPISSRIIKYIREQQVSGGMVGLYNANLTARLNGITDKSETTVKGEVAIFKSLDLDVPEDNSSKQDS